MNLKNASASVETFKLSSEFSRLRDTLLQQEHGERINRPLAYWALPVDRRLPLAFLGRSIRDLLETPFEELSATPGIGQKKIGTLVELLARVAKKQPPASPTKSAAEKPTNGRAGESNASFDPSTVSELLWEQWRDTVSRHGVGYESLGHLARSLRSLPTVMWDTPLSQYAGYTVAEIRQMKTHGEKRVRAILEIFHAVHQALSHAPTNEHLTVRLVPRFVVEIDRNVAEMIEGDKVPSRAELRDRIVRPLVEQLRVDIGPAVARLVRERLGISGQPQPVRHQSRRLGVTRARVYQLLEGCAMAMAVRWPEGGHRLRAPAPASPCAPLPLIDWKRSTRRLIFSFHPRADLHRRLAKRRQIERAFCATLARSVSEGACESGFTLAHASG